MDERKKYRRRICRWNLPTGKKVNRAEFVKILIETISGSEEIENCKYRAFNDVPTQSWYSPYICVAQKKGIIQGYPNGTFQPEKNITFPEAAKVIAEVLDLTIPKVAEGASWYEPYIEALALKKAIPTSISNLQHPVNRGEMAEQIWRIKEDVTNLSSRKSRDF
ncbi:S-layer homology domain-containing protein [Candidatus Gracilibacteria bacterium]|nr:S-layer homology domain-containing protein [Candidatus Gracilibacteria bacterium]